MKAHYEVEQVTLYHGDCIEVMRTLPDNSVHAVVTDPPYGLEFMGKEWDGADGFRRSLNEADAGRESVFGRTSAKAPEYNTGRGVRVAAERAAELTTKGKGHSTSAGPYLAAGVDSIRVAGVPFQQWCEVWAAECLRILKPGGYMLAFGGSRTWHRLAVAVEDAGFEIRDSIAWLYGSGFPKSRNLEGEWEGWGTALKPAFEPIVVGRKPLVGTVALNMAEHGTGAINIDATRVATDEDRARPPRSPNNIFGGGKGTNLTASESNPDGRWPSNVVLDQSQAASLDAQSGITSSKAADRGIQGRHDAGSPETRSPKAGTNGVRGHDDSGGASRFFPTFRDGEASADKRYTDSGATDFAATPGARREAVAKSEMFPTFHYEAKAPGTERPDVDGVQHPTVKPLDLMRWLVRLVASPGAIILEPFAGSGTTLEAAILEGFNVIGIEREDSYLPLIMQRLSKPLQQSLFDDIA